MHDQPRTADIGERIEFEGTVLRAEPGEVGFTGFYRKPTVYLFTDGDGNFYEWTSHNESVQLFYQVPYRVRGTVKEIGAEKILLTRARVTRIEA